MAKAEAQASGSDVVRIDWRAPQMEELHPAVRDHLRALQVDELKGAPDARTWFSVLKWASERIGNLDEDRKRLALSIEVERELCDLATSESKQRAELEREVGLAVNVQRCFVPRATKVRYEGLELSSLYRPVASCGGDWWNVYRLSDQRIMILIGDVTGHGLGPAMLTGLAKGAADTVVRKSAGTVTPAQMLTELNLALCGLDAPGFNMTCAAAVLDPGLSNVSFASAGHPLPYVVRGQCGARTLRQLVSRGDPLGASPQTEYQNSWMGLEPGDGILWYTDGLLDLENERGEVFGEKRLRKLLLSGASIAPATLRETLRGAMFEFMGKAPPVDDITLVIARMTQPKARRTITLRGV